MTNIKIYDRNGWKLHSVGHGWGYCLECDGKSVWFQDDDASEFASRIMDSDGWLFDNCEEIFSDYSDVMQPNRR